MLSRYFPVRRWRLATLRRDTSAKGPSHSGVGCGSAGAVGANHYLAVGGRRGKIVRS